MARIDRPPGLQQAAGATSASAGYTIALVADTTVEEQSEPEALRRAGWTGAVTMAE